MQQGNVLEQPRPVATPTPTPTNELIAEPECRHHWKIESPNGATSMGRCKRCGVEREFMNSSSDSIWENDSESGRGGWRGRGRHAVADVPNTATEAPAPISESTLGSLLGSGYRGRIE